MSSIEKVILGALGGLSAVLVKFLGQDYAVVVSHASDLTADQLLAYELGYGLLTPILMFLGAFVAWLSDEQKRIKVVALAITAPAMITTWAGGHKTDSSLALSNFIVPSAYAQSPDFAREKIRPVTPDAVTEKDTWDKLQMGVGTFFGYGKEPQKYWVIVGSYKDKDAAQQFADNINAEDKTLNAWVGLRLSGNDFYPVIVGNEAFLSGAKELKRKALTSKLIRDAYFSTGERR